MSFTKLENMFQKAKQIKRQNNRPSLGDIEYWSIMGATENQSGYETILKQWKNISTPENYQWTKDNCIKHILRLARRDARDLTKEEINTIEKIKKL